MQVEQQLQAAPARPIRSLLQARAKGGRAQGSGGARTCVLPGPTLRMQGGTGARPPSSPASSAVYVVSAPSRM